MSTAQTRDALREALALRDELAAYAAQLTRMETQAGFAGPDTSVRVKDPAFLSQLLIRARAALDVRLRCDLANQLTEARALAQRVGEERDRAVADAEKRGAALMRHAAVTACLDLNDAYRETSEHQIKQRNTAKAAEAIAWADGAMLCARTIRDLSFDLRAARSVTEPTEGGDA